MEMEILRRHVTFVPLPSSTSSMSSVIPMDDRLPLRCRIIPPAYFRPTPFTETPAFVYYVFSSIGLAAAEESGLLRQNFRTKYPHARGCGRYEKTKQFLDDRRFLEAGLATIYAVAGIREHINDEAILAACADLDAVLEFMRDEFVESWGPHFSRKAARRRAKALARQQRAAAREAAHEAQRAAEEAAEASGVPLGPAAWGNGGGWGDDTTGWGGEPTVVPSVAYRLSSVTQSILGSGRSATSCGACDDSPPVSFDCFIPYLP
ncbi:hypothetical protein B0H13DRAFT_1890153 [Mycena leptocephala]|nr:hypothetical protein B0H13DRAFT_1890153 [Mycena leptocephala]